MERLRAAAARWRKTDDGARSRYARYLQGVEPALAARPRVHRFAEVPVVGEASMGPEPVGVWIDPRAGGDAALTRDSLAGQSHPAADVLDGAWSEVIGSRGPAWIAIVRAGDVLAPVALERIGQAAALAPDARVLTADEDVTTRSGRRGSPRFAPGPSPDRMLACAPPDGLLALRRDAGDAVAGVDPADPAVGRYELLLRLAGPDGRRQGHIPLILCHRAPEPSGVEDGLGDEVVRRVLHGWAHRAARIERLAGGGRRVRRPLTSEPSVEVIVCFRDRPELLARCARSVLEESTYGRLGLCLVDNGSSEPETADRVAHLARDPRVRVVRDEKPFNFAALNNGGVRTSAADVVVLLNNDTEVLTPTWIEELLEEAVRPEVGAVAPLLTYPNGRVQHAGAALGLHGYAGHPFAGLRPEEDTPFGRAVDGTRNWLAVTAACLMVEREKFGAVGGFDESFVVAGNDVDLCLRLTARGHRSLCVPHVRLLHDESLSRGGHIDHGDFARSEASYGAFRTVGDPFYNPSLTLTRTDCGVREPGEGPA